MSHGLQSNTDRTSAKLSGRHLENVEIMKDATRIQNIGQILKKNSKILENERLRVTSPQKRHFATLAKMLRFAKKWHLTRQLALFRQSNGLKRVSLVVK